MIGVIADSEEWAVVREFFELFKTPWEFYRNGRQYEVLVCTGEGQFDGSPNLVVLYGGGKVHCEEKQRNQTGHQQGQRFVLYQGNRLAIYGDTITFLEKGERLLTDEDSQQCVAYLDRSEKTVLARIGYDLFGEIRTLLTIGQPAANADIPALELHIAVLRDLITACGVPLVEIPPVPDGHQLIVCLTHDIDHPSIRHHKWDHTMFGFLYRAVFVSLYNLVRRRITVRDLVKNWAAALKLPFVYLGFGKDPWQEFDDRYLELENGIPSTYFVIPFKDRSGRTSDGSAPTFRAARYDATDIADKLQKLRAAGCEIGLHGIDAWLDSARGQEELEEIRRLTGASEIGVRMHWLYYDRGSPVAMEKAGAAYDSTIGYNETVGYRAGTAQAYKPLEASRLLELPLHVMDTALFYPAYLGLSPLQARSILRQMADNAIQFGGCLTINWHDRSIAPERLWGASYGDLLRDLQSRGAWFATAGQATSWFRKRRSVVFETDCTDPDAVGARLAPDHCDNLPGLRLRIHKGRESCETDAYGPGGVVDIAFTESIDTRVPCGADR